MRRTILLLSLVALAGCRLPPVSGCRPGDQRCREGWTEVCSPTQRWHTYGDVACTFVPGQGCLVSDAGVASCAVLSDGGGL